MRGRFLQISFSFVRSSQKRMSQRMSGIHMHHIDGKKAATAAMPLHSPKLKPYPPPRHSSGNSFPTFGKLEFRFCRGKVCGAWDFTFRASCWYNMQIYFD